MCRRFSDKKAYCFVVFFFRWSTWNTREWNQKFQNFFSVFFAYIFEFFFFFFGSLNNMFECRCKYIFLYCQTAAVTNILRKYVFFFLFQVFFIYTFFRTVFTVLLNRSIIWFSDKSKPHDVNIDIYMAIRLHTNTFIHQIQIESDSHIHWNQRIHRWLLSAPKSHL